MVEIPILKGKGRSAVVVAHARVNNKDHHIGVFNTEDEAIEAATAWRVEHMPFAVSEGAKVG
jgi:hypothetical protein